MNEIYIVGGDCKHCQKLCETIQEKNSEIQGLLERGPCDACQEEVKELQLRIEELEEENGRLKRAFEEIDGPDWHCNTCGGPEKARKALEGGGE